MCATLALVLAAAATAAPASCPNSTVPVALSRDSNTATGFLDLAHREMEVVEDCLAACCADPTGSCTAFTFTTFQPHGARSAPCPQGTSCCWLKAGAATGTLEPKANCTSGRLGRRPPPPPPPPSPYHTPVLDFIKVIANRTDGNLRDPSAVVQDPATKRWHL